MIHWRNYNLTPLLVGLTLAAMVATSSVEAVAIGPARVGEIFNGGFHFNTYADFERFFEHELPEYEQQLRLAKEDGSEQDGVDNPQLYEYALHQLNVEPVRRLYWAHRAPNERLIAALDELHELWLEDDLFRQISEPVVASLIEVITLDQVQALGLKLGEAIMMDDYDSIKVKNETLRQNETQIRLKPRIEQWRWQMCQLISGGQYDEGEFNCDDIEQLRHFLNLDKNRQSSLEKVSQFAAQTFRRQAKLDGHGKAAPNPRAASVPAHQEFAVGLQEALEPVYGLFDHAMLAETLLKGDQVSYARGRLEAKLNDNNDDLLNYWYQVYHICKLVKMVRFSR